MLVVFTTPIWLAGRRLYSETLRAAPVSWMLRVWLQARDAGARGAFCAGDALCGLAIDEACRASMAKARCLVARSASR
jgi:hypothetical protein